MGGGGTDVRSFGVSYEYIVLSLSSGLSVAKKGVFGLLVADDDAVSTSMSFCCCSISAFPFDDDKLEKVVGDLLKKENKTLATAESCTGGLVAHMLTSVPGSSEYYKGSIVSYSYEVKTSELNVPVKMLEQFGAVSEETVKQMAIGVRQRLNTDYSIAISGIAGPDGGTEDKPVGTVWMAVGNDKKISTQQINVRFDRAKNIEITALQALNFLRKFITGNE